MSEIVLTSAGVTDLVGGIGNALRRVVPPLIFTSSQAELAQPVTFATDEMIEDALWARRGVEVLARIEAGVEQTIPWEQAKAELGL